MTRDEAVARLKELAREPDMGVRLNKAVACLEERLLTLGETDVVDAFRKLDREWT